MKKVYNYENNELKFVAVNGSVFNFKLHNGITRVKGLSATGKTMLYDDLSIKKKLGEDASGLDLSNIYLYSEGDIFDFKDEKCLVIIDRGDLFLSEEICEKIVACDYARFLIFTRSKHNLYVPLQNIANLVIRDDIISLEYKH